MTMSQTQLLHELEPVVADELNRHEKLAKEWFPHEYIPWSEGRDFDGPYGGEPWQESDSKLPEPARVSLIVNLLTEDNLPSYHHEIATTFGRDGAWGTWVHRWTAEEDRHGTAIRDYLTVTRAVDPVKLERARMAHMQSGFITEYDTMLQQLAYVSFQELATRISHRNTGRYSTDPVADRIMQRISADENLHMVFYRDMLEAALQIDPSRTVEAITEEVINFEMPGTGIPGFQRKAVEIAAAGIYDLRIHHDDVVWPLLRHWNVFEVEGLDDDGKKALERLRQHLDELDANARRFEEKRAARAERLLARGRQPS